MPISAPRSSSASRKKAPPPVTTPASTTKMSMEELTDAANKLSLLEDCSHVRVVGSAYPTIIGTWDNQDTGDSDSSDEDYEDSVYTMIRIIMHNAIHADLIVPEWLDPHTLLLTIRWP